MWILGLKELMNYGELTYCSLHMNRQIMVQILTWLRKMWKQY